MDEHLSQADLVSTYLKTSILLSTENTKFWPILAILSQFYGLFGLLLTGLSNAVAYLKCQIPGKSSDFSGSGLIPRNLLLAGCFGRHPTVIRLGSFPWVDRSLFSRKNISKSCFSCLVLQKQDRECFPSYSWLTSHSKPFDSLPMIIQQQTLKPINLITDVRLGTSIHLRTSPRGDWSISHAFLQPILKPAKMEHGLFLLKSAIVSDKDRNCGGCCKKGNWSRWVGHLFIFWRVSDCWSADINVSTKLS